MALSLGRLSILVGAGILGSVLAKEGRMPSVSDVLSGAIKIVLKPIKQTDSASATKPRNDALIRQVNSLREELQLLAANRPLTIVTSSAGGRRRYGIIIVVVVIGYGYVWWKGWKLPDFMFATKRGLEDARNSVANKLEQVYSSIRAFERACTSRIDRTAEKYDENGAIVAALKDDASDLRVEVPTDRIESIKSYVKNLMMKVDEIEGRQGTVNDGVGTLMLYTLENKNTTTDRIQDSPSSSSRPALEYPRVTSVSRTGSLPAALSVEPPSPSASNGYSEAKKPLRNAVSSVGLKERQGFSVAMDDTPSPGLFVGAQVSPRVSNGTHAPQNPERSSTPSTELPPRQPNVRSAAVISRTVSVTQNFKF